MILDIISLSELICTDVCHSTKSIDCNTSGLESRHARLNSNEHFYCNCWLVVELGIIFILSLLLILVHGVRCVGVG